MPEDFLSAPFPASLILFAGLRLFRVYAEKPFERFHYRERRRGGVGYVLKQCRHELRIDMESVRQIYVLFPDLLRQALDSCQCAPEEIYQFFL